MTSSMTGDGEIQALDAMAAGLLPLFEPPLARLAALSQEDAPDLDEAAAAEAMAAALRPLRALELSAARIARRLEEETRRLAIQAAPDGRYTPLERLVGVVSRRARAVRQQRRLRAAAEHDLARRRAAVAALAEAGDALAERAGRLAAALSPLHGRAEAGLERIVAARKAAFVRFERDGAPEEADRLGRLEQATLLFQSLADGLNAGLRALHVLIDKLSADTGQRLLLLAALTPERDDLSPPAPGLRHFADLDRRHRRGMLSSDIVARHRARADDRFSRLFDQALDKEAGRQRLRPKDAGGSPHA